METKDTTFKPPLVLFQRINSHSHSQFIKVQPYYEAVPLIEVRARKHTTAPLHKKFMSKAEKTWIGLK